MRHPRSNPVEFHPRLWRRRLSQRVTSRWVAHSLTWLQNRLKGSDASTRTDISVLRKISPRPQLVGPVLFQGANLFLLCKKILRDPPRPLPPTATAGLKNCRFPVLGERTGTPRRRVGEVRAVLETVDLSTDQGVVPPQRLVFRLWPVLIAVSLLVLAAVGDIHDSQQQALSQCRLCRSNACASSAGSAASRQ